MMLEKNEYGSSSPGRKKKRKLKLKLKPNTELRVGWGEGKGEKRCTGSGTWVRPMEESLVDFLIGNMGFPAPATEERSVVWYEWTNGVALPEDRVDAGASTGKTSGRSFKLDDDDVYLSSK